MIDACLELWVTDGLELLLVEVTQRVEGASANVPIDTGRIRDIEDRVADRAAANALIRGGQEAAGPETGASRRISAS